MRSPFGSQADCFPIVDGTIVNPCYLDHKNAKNWVAIVTRDYSGAPGGLVRQFFKHGPRTRVHVPDELAPGNWLEFGGDKTSMGGSKKANRQYYVVLSVTPEAIGVQKIDFDDIGRAEDHSPPPEPPNPLAEFTDDQIVAEAKRRGLFRKGGPIVEAEIAASPPLLLA